MIALFSALIYAFTPPSFSAITGLDKKACQYAIRETLGVEWEHSPLYDAHDEFFGKVYYGPRSTAELLARKRLRELYAFHTRLDGKWVQDLLPAEVTHHPEFAMLRAEIPHAFRDRDGEVFLEGWPQLSTGEGLQVLRTLMKIRGQDGKNLTLRKNAEAWRKYRNRYDRMLQDELAEEWRDGQFGNLEFPMLGAVKEFSEAEQFLLNLWGRLDLIDPKMENAEYVIASAFGHIHWLPDLRPFSDSMRKRMYSSIVGYWGDANDRLFVRSMDFSQLRERSTHSRNLWGFDKVADIHSFIYGAFEQYSFQNLRRSTYRRLEISANGVRVRDRQLDLQPDIDPNFPPDFKRLPIGMRGVYGQETLPGEAFVTKVGLEGRTGDSYAETLSYLPKRNSGQATVDVGALLEHEREGLRGLMDDPTELKSAAQNAGLDLRAIDDVVDSVAGTRWTPSAIRAKLLSPLTPWLQHPLMTNVFARISANERAKFIQQYDRALAQFVAELNRLTQARHNPAFPYAPLIADPRSFPVYPDGTNAVARRDSFIRSIPSPTQPGFSITGNPDPWYAFALSNELARFYRDAGFAEIFTEGLDGGNSL